jgi:hypothetical protein
MYINHLTFLVHCSPQILLLTPDLHEYFVNKKYIAETLTPAI